MERCRCSKVLVMMQLITQRCSVSVQLSTLDRTVDTYYNKKYKETSVRNPPKKCQTKNISATMNGLSVQLSLHASTIVLKMIPEDP